MITGVCVVTIFIVALKIKQKRRATLLHLPKRSSVVKVENVKILKERERVREKHGKSKNEESLIAIRLAQMPERTAAWATNCWETIINHKVGVVHVRVCVCVCVQQQCSSQ